MEINEEGSRQLPTLISLRRLLRQSNPKSRPANISSLALSVSVRMCQVPLI